MAGLILVHSAPADSDDETPTVIVTGRDGWQDQSNCLGVDPELFFPERGVSIEPAREVCRSCTVRVECLHYALDNNEKFGVWGGTSERERRKLRPIRRRELAASEIAQSNLQVVQ